MSDPAVTPKPHSASSLKLYLGCPRRWAFERLYGFAEPETTQKTFGKDVHKEIEDWLRFGIFPKMPATLKWLGMFAEHPYYPSKESSQAEEHFQMTIAGVQWHGYTDWRRQKVLGSRQHIVGDAKTTNDLKYALKAGPGGLLYDSDDKIDPQSTLYATREFVEGAFEVDLHWAYVQSKAPYTTRLVESTVERGACEDAYGVFHGQAQEMNQLYQLRPKANDIPYRTSYCNAFNKPCSQAERCNRPRGMFTLEPLNLDTHPELQMNDFLAAIKASVPAVDDDAPPPPPESDDEEATPPPPAPPEEDDAPPPPPEDEELEAEKLVAEYMASQRKPKSAPTEVEAGFINAPEAKGKKPYATPEEAAIGEGVCGQVSHLTVAEVVDIAETMERVATTPDPIVESEKPTKTRKARAKKADKAANFEVLKAAGLVTVAGPVEPAFFTVSDLRRACDDEIDQEIAGRNDVGVMREVMAKRLGLKEPAFFTADEPFTTKEGKLVTDETVDELFGPVALPTLQDDVRAIVHEEVKAIFLELANALVAVLSVKS